MANIVLEKNRSTESLATVLADGSLKCDRCSYSSVSANDLVKHLKTTHYSECMASHYFDFELNQSKAYQCEVCLSQFTTYKGMRQHVGKVHERTYKDKKCKDCGAKFKNKYALKYHFRQVHEQSNKIQCQLCSLVLYNKYKLKVHMAKSHLVTN